MIRSSLIATPHFLNYKQVKPTKFIIFIYTGKYFLQFFPIFIVCHFNIIRTFMHNTIFTPFSPTKAIIILPHLRENKRVFTNISTFVETIYMGNRISLLF